MTFEKQYEEICLTIWGCIPLDITWAKNTNLYKEAKQKHESKEKDKKVC
jgi:hypothetical protein